MEEEEIIDRFDRLGFLDGLTNKRNSSLAMDYALKITKHGDKMIPLELPILRRIFNDIEEDVDRNIILTIVNEVSTALELSESIIEIRKKMDKYKDVESIYCGEVADRFIIRLNEILNKKADN